jgi:hypothetical protein
MKYLSKSPFTGGANSRAYVHNWEAIFGSGRKGSVPEDPDCGRDGKSGERPDGTSSPIIDLRALKEKVWDASNTALPRIVLDWPWILFMSRLIGTITKVSSLCTTQNVLVRRLQASLTLRREDRLPFVLNEGEQHELSALLDAVESLGRFR